MDEIIYLSDDEEPMVIIQNENEINNELTHNKNCSSSQSADQIDKNTGENHQMMEMEQSTSSQQKPMEEVNEDEEEEDECKIVYVKGYQADPLGDKAKGIRSWFEEQGVQLHLPRQNFTSENAENEKDNAMDNGEGTSAASTAGPENGGKISKKRASIKKRPKKAAKPKGNGIVATTKEPKNEGKTSTKRAPKKREVAAKSKNDDEVLAKTKKPGKGGKTSAKGAPIKKRPKRAMTKKSKKAPAKPKKEGCNGVQNNEKDVYLVQKILKMINNGKGTTKQTYLCQIRDTKGQIKEAEVNSKKINKKMLNKFKKSMTEESKLYRIEAITNVRIKQGSPEYLVKWKGYVQKDWVPQANLNIDVDEGNKKCILDLAKKTHKIGQPMEEEELELAYQFVLQILGQEL